MAANYVLLERIELNASAASITFSNIPQSGYTDLKIVGSARVSSAGETSPPIQRLEMLINGVNTGAKYSIKMLYGNGSSASSAGGGPANRDFYDGAATASGATANTFSNFEVYLPNYTASVNKSFSIDSVTENNGTGADASFTAGLFADTTAISSITFQPYDLSNFVQYSTFSLYGLAATGTTPVIAPKATGGNITTDGTYWYHTFLSSGTFTPATSLSCDYLVVAGGGGGGLQGAGTSYGQGGGGAGGLRSTVTATGGGGSLESPISVTAQNYTVTVGAGGASNTSGSNSVFSSITSTGGGRGGNGNNANSSAVGGSGGGAGAWGTQYNGSAGTANQGYAGGNNAGNNIDGAGGGGGAGAVGANGVSGTSGQGGNGVLLTAFASATNTGVSSYYAGGGGGGGGQSGTLTSVPGGAGGGGNGGGNTTSANGSTAGIANTGGGGGGSGRNSGGGSSGYQTGGSGIVIIRYTVA